MSLLATAWLIAAITWPQWLGLSAWLVLGLAFAFKGAQKELARTAPAPLR